MTHTFTYDTACRTCGLTVPATTKSTAIRTIRNHTCTGRPSKWFTSHCACGWSYGPGLQTDVVDHAGYHRRSAC